tara:strand:- start:769 stop:1605 length:837 start_codon:yes stop_codon:yes gene_type:complete
LTGELNKLTSKSESYKDDRIWKPETDKAGNGYAVIRFLPAPQNEELPWVRVFNHGFKGPGGWYIENSLTTLGQKDPVSEMNSQLWNSGVDSDKEIARQRKRRLSYFANIYVVSDPKNPENEGKVFLYKFGKKIFDKIMDKMQPEFEDDEAVNPFDLWTGANFRLKIRKVAGFVNYDKSEFESASALLDGDDEKLETLWKSQHSLQEFLSPSNFKSYDELKEKLDSVLKGDVRHMETAENSNIQQGESKTTSEDTSSASDDSFENEDALSYFEKLANEG